jgi:hypothetical protein
VLFCVLEGAFPWWEPCSSGASFGHWKRGEVETYGEWVGVGQLHEKGVSLRVGDILHGCSWG